MHSRTRTHVHSNARTRPPAPPTHARRCLSAGPKQRPEASELSSLLAGMSSDPAAAVSAHLLDVAGPGAVTGGGGGGTVVGQAHQAPRTLY
jgi:hypothetical protein